MKTQNLLTMNRSRGNPQSQKENERIKRIISININKIEKHGSLKSLKDSIQYYIKSKNLLFKQNYNDFAKLFYN